MSENHDFIIVGSGAGSFCAALVLRAAGKRVLIVEKADLVGGTTATSGGVMWIPNNRYMKEAGVPDSREQAIAYLDAAVGDHAAMPGASRERRAAFVDAAPQMIDFLVAQGIKLRRIPHYPDHYSVAGASEPGRTVVSELFDIKQLGEWKARLRPGFLPLPANLDEAMQLPLMKRDKAAKKVLLRILGRALKDKLTGKHRATAGQALQGQMLHAALKAGVEIRLQSPVSELIVEHDRVVGVIANGQRVTATLGVLLNAGGFARNQRMLDQYQPGVKSEWTSVIAEDKGEMIEAGLRIGAAVAQMDQRIGMQITLPPGDKTVKPNLDTSKPHCIVVDGSGVRYMRESGAPTDICRKMLDRHKTAPAVPSFMIVDSQYINTYMLAGSMPGPKKPQAWFDSKILHKAETIEALATDCGLPADALRATVERYNEQVRRGTDEDFRRGAHAFDEWSGDPLKADTRTLGTIEQGPFYAMQMYPGDVSTFGGLVCDVHARVLRDDGSVIEGLYATGTSTASVMGPVEGGPGGSIGPTMTWAWLAAQHALQGTN
ncbi:FAD-dependent oxidoreductase [Solimonas terrae]|uniref:FAD-dependent oxidoreductase n=1 Tax=Solimonas terrae TaxID=1396819 RepID=A0A6M2BPG5_9GAMM|nr:FAD-dependent oxidoreductase [Solimonas terrae]NGY03933.1 FAD-dependent oxidoreductase [Solimonas terrae]